MLTLDTFHELLTPNGQRALAAAVALQPTEANVLPALTLLRKDFPPDLAAAALETALLRHRARAKFSRAAVMYFTREALEQASGEAVARHRTTRYAALGVPVTDVCCSIGGDGLSLAEGGLTVRGIDLDAVRVAMAEANAVVYGVEQRATFEVADARAFAAPNGTALFFDPARRKNGRRQWRAEDYEPPLAVINGWIEQAAGLGVKVAPGIDYEQLPYTCEVEVVSVGGEVKEACLWFGKLRQAERRATLLPSGAMLEYAPVPPVPAVPPLRYLYEPDGAVIRAHLVEQLAHRIDAQKIDDEIAFLTADTLTETPFARAFRVLEVQPFNLKRLRARLRELDVGQVVVKKRGSPIDPQVLEKQLRLHGSNALTIVLTRVQGQPSVVLCESPTTKERELFALL